MATKDEMGVKSTQLFSQTMENGILRRLFVTSAYDLRNALDGKNYGIHGTDWYFVASRGGAAVDLKWMMPFYLESVRDGAVSKYGFDGLGDIGYHTLVRIDKYQSESDHCMWLNGKPCFGSGSSIAAMEVFNLFVADPEELWKNLESRLSKLEEEVKGLKDGD
jgi:hypothetical protein